MKIIVDLSDTFVPSPTCSGQAKERKTPGCEEKPAGLGSAWHPSPTVRDAANGPSRLELDLGLSPVTKAAHYASPIPLTSGFSSRPKSHHSKKIFASREYGMGDRGNSGNDHLRARTD